MARVELQGRRGEEREDSAVAGESETGEGGKEMGDSGSESWLLLQMCCGEDEKGNVREVGHGEAGGSE